MTDPSKTKDPFAVTASPGFSSWLADTGGSLAFTTYQANKLFFVGTDLQTRRISLFERTFQRCMGLGLADNGLWFSSLHTLWYAQNFLDDGQHHDGHDAVFVPLSSHTTGDIDVHDIHVRQDGRPLFVATRFNCLAELRTGVSFQPVWKPPWISEIVAEDRCHLNGLATIDDAPAYVTAIGQTNSAGGWRSEKRAGGVVFGLRETSPVATGLSMPHSPRWHGGRVWLLQSGTGEFGYVGPSGFEAICRLQGFARGLAFIGDHAVIGLSRPRLDKTFEGLELNERLTEAGLNAICGLAVVNTKSGALEHLLELSGPVRELYDVQFIPFARKPQAIGLVANDIKYHIRPGPYPAAR